MFAPTVQVVRNVAINSNNARTNWLAVCLGLDGGYTVCLLGNKAQNADSQPLAEQDLLQALQFLARLESNRFARRDRYLRARARIAANTCLAGPDVKNAEPT